MKLRTILYVLLSLISISCTYRKEDKVKNTVPIAYTVEELDSLYHRLDQGEFIVDELHDEFRTPVHHHFTMKQRAARNIKVWEYTWQTGKDSLLTVWYLPKGDSLILLDYSRYSKYALF